MKSLLKKAGDQMEDPYLALMTYCATPLEFGYTPAELLMSCKIRTNIPMPQKQLSPEVPMMSTLQQKEEVVKKTQKRDFNERHSASPLKTLLPGDKVWLSDEETMATILGEAGKRLYNVNTQSGSTFRRNRRQLIAILDEDNTQTEETTLNSQQPVSDNSVSPSIQNENNSEQPNVKRTSSGRVTKAPERFHDKL